MAYSNDKIREQQIMKKLQSILGLSAVILSLAACQNVPHRYNGTSGYEVENSTANTATIRYTLAIKPSETINQSKLQEACKKVLSKNQTYQIKILSTNEIINPASVQPQQGINLGNTNAKFELANTNNNLGDNTAARNALGVRPDTLNVVRYQCS